MAAGVNGRTERRKDGKTEGRKGGRTEGRNDGKMEGAAHARLIAVKRGRARVNGSVPRSLLVTIGR
jgi:hypothetical protein